jgi:hypothetical protein
MSTVPLITRPNIKFSCLEVRTFYYLKSLNVWFKTWSNYFVSKLLFYYFYPFSRHLRCFEFRKSKWINKKKNFQVEGRDIPIVHRVLKLHEKEDGTVKFLTKGDNNSVDDRGLYAPGQYWLTRYSTYGQGLIISRHIIYRGSFETCFKYIVKGVYPS